MISPSYPPLSESFAHPKAGRYDVSIMQTTAPTTWDDTERCSTPRSSSNSRGPATACSPNILFVSNERQGIIGEQQVTGAPDLMVEILSPSTAHRDRGIKLDLYARRGVREYWIVDPVEDVVDVWRFEQHPGRERFTGELPVRLGTQQVGTIDLDEVFSRHLDVWDDAARERAE